MNLLKRIFWLLAALLPSLTALGQSVHSGEDHTGLDWIIVAFGVAVVIGVLVFTIKYLVWPGEKSRRHIKRRILKDEWQDGNDDK